MDFFCDGVFHPASNYILLSAPVAQWRYRTRPLIYVSRDYRRVFVVPEYAEHANAHEADRAQVAGLLERFNLPELRRVLGENAVATRVAVG